MTVVTSSTELLDALRTVSTAVAAGERAAGFDLAALVTNLEGQIASGALALTWDASVTGPDGQALDATITREHDRVVVEVDTLVEEDDGMFAIDLDALAAKPVYATPAPVFGVNGPFTTPGTDLRTMFYPSELHGASLITTRGWLEARKVSGATCPACGGQSKLYTRHINSGMARAMIRMYRVGGESGMDWIHLASKTGSTSREEGKLRYWGLVENQLETLGKAGRAGVWRLTPLGVDFVLGEESVPDGARVFHAEFLGLTGPQHTILDALAKDFDYDELMRG